MRTITLNEDDMRPDCGHNNLATCGHCNRNWCFTCNPTPSARCPFEYEHEYDDVEDEGETTYRGPLAPHGGCNHRECRECFPDEKVRNRLEQEEIERAIRFLTDYGFTVTKDDDPVAEADAKRPKPEVGMVVCDCRYKHLKIAEVDEDGDTIKLEDGRTCSYYHCTHNVPHFDWDHPARPCPVCDEFGGFHNDAKHGNVDPKFLREKGWHKNG